MNRHCNTSISWPYDGKSKHLQPLSASHARCLVMQIFAYNTHVDGSRESRCNSNVWCLTVYVDIETSLLMKKTNSKHVFQSQANPNTCALINFGFLMFHKMISSPFSFKSNLDFHESISVNRNEVWVKCFAVGGSAS